MREEERLFERLGELSLALDRVEGHLRARGTWERFRADLAAILAELERLRVLERL